MLAHFRSLGWWLLLLLRLRGNVRLLVDGPWDDVHVPIQLAQLGDWLGTAVMHACVAGASPMSRRTETARRQDTSRSYQVQVDLLTG